MKNLSRSSSVSSLIGLFSFLALVYAANSHAVQPDVPDPPEQALQGLERAADLFPDHVSLPDQANPPHQSLVPEPLTMFDLTGMYWSGRFPPGTDGRWGCSRTTICIGGTRKNYLGGFAYGGLQPPKTYVDGSERLAEATFFQFTNENGGPMTIKDGSIRLYFDASQSITLRLSSSIMLTSSPGCRHRIAGFIDESGYLYVAFEEKGCSVTRYAYSYDQAIANGPR